MRVLASARGKTLGRKFSVSVAGYVEQRGSIIYVKPLHEYGWYRWTGSAWEHYCWYQEVKPL